MSGDSSASAPVVQIAIGICTFKRPAGLRAVLEALVTQEFRRVARPAVQVFVIDNDADPEVARWLTQFNDVQFENDHGWRVRYLAEPQRGIAQARNCFLRNIPGGSDLVAFLDDDEVPVSVWLDELVFGLQSTNADVISGPVIAKFLTPPPQWLSDGRFFSVPRRKHLADYAPIDFGVMGNCLLRRSLLDDARLRFPEELGLVGSEDSYFFHVLRQKNARMTWTNRAIAHHQVPRDRATLIYLLRREFRVGCGKSLVTRMTEARKATLYRLAAKDLVRLLNTVLLGVPASLIGLLRTDQYERVKPLFDLYQWTGRLYGFFGGRYEQYGKERL